MTVILHAGMPKTGTTSIQATLDLNRQALLSAGVIYPELSDSPFGGHWQLSAYWEPRKRGRLVRRRGDGGEDWTASVRSAVRDTLKRAKANDQAVLLSTEALGSPRSEAGCRAILDDIESQQLPVKVIAYVRPPLDLCASHVQQNIKVVRSKHIASPLDWVTNEIFRAELLIRVFGRERVQLKFYRKGFDVVTEFMSWMSDLLQRPIPELKRAPNVNTSLSGPACAMLALAKKARSMLDGGVDEKVAVLLRRNLSEYTPAVPPPRLTLPAAWTESIVANNAEAWNRLVDLVDATEDEKQKARYHVDGNHTHVEADRDAELDWILSYYDENHVNGLRAYSAARDGRGGTEVCEMIDKLAGLHAALNRRAPAAVPHHRQARSRGT